MDKKIIFSIGDTLHRLRKEKKLSLTELSQKSGVQLATLSRIENNKMTGTLESHRAIADALDIQFVNLYSNVYKSPSTEVDLPTLAETGKHAGEAYYEILTKNSSLKKMLPLIIKIEPKREIKESASDGEKFIFVLEGEIEVDMANQKYRLKKNSTIYLDVVIEHVIRNLRNTPSKLLCVKTPVRL